MGRRRSTSISVEVEVDIWQVLEEVSTEDLIEELKSRDDKPSSETTHGLTIGKLGTWDTESLLEAVRRDDGRMTVDLMREAFR